MPDDVQEKIGRMSAQIDSIQIWQTEKGEKIDDMWDLMQQRKGERKMSLMLAGAVSTAIGFGLRLFGH